MQRLAGLSQRSAPVVRLPLNDTVYEDRTMAWLETRGLNELPVTEVRGAADVLACGPMLVDLAARCGQRGVVDHLPFQLSVPYFGSKLPCIFLLRAPRGSDEARQSPAPPFAAVLLHEYRLLGVRTGFYLASDMAGDGTVLAPKELRAEVAATVAEYLLRRGGRVVLLSGAGLDPGTGQLRAPHGEPGRLVAAEERPLLRTLRLRGSLDATLAIMGSHTRRNLRQARRNAAGKLGVSFEAAAEISEEQFLQVNREGFYPVPDRVARWRYRSARATAGGFIAAVRTGEGDWLALLGGRRYLTEAGPRTAVDWQLNHTKYARFSPGSLLRILLIEHELTRGTAELRFEGGTPHSMRSAFEPEVVSDRLFARGRWTPGMLRLLGRLLPKGNLLGDRLLSPSLVWRA